MTDLNCTAKIRNSAAEGKVIVCHLASKTVGLDLQLCGRQGFFMSGGEGMADLPVKFLILENENRT